MSGTVITGLEQAAAYGSECRLRVWTSSVVIGPDVLSISAQKMRPTCHAGTLVRVVGYAVARLWSRCPVDPESRFENGSRMTIWISR
jgi:hypothetical protein